MVFLETSLHVLTTFVSTWDFCFWACCSDVLVDFIEGHLRTTEKQAGNFAKGTQLSYVLLEVSTDDSTAKLVIIAINHFKRTLCLMLLHVTPPDYLTAIFVAARNRQLHDQSSNRDVWFEWPNYTLGAEWASVSLSDADHTKQIVTAGSLYCVLKYIQTNWA